MSMRRSGIFSTRANEIDFRLLLCQYDGKGAVEKQTHKVKMACDQRTHGSRRFLYTERSAIEKGRIIALIILPLLFQCFQKYDRRRLLDGSLGHQLAVAVIHSADDGDVAEAVTLEQLLEFLEGELIRDLVGGQGAENMVYCQKRNGGIL